MCDVGKEDRAYFIRDLPEFLEVDLSGIGGSTADDDLRLDDLSDVHHSVIVDAAVKLDAVSETLIVLSGKTRLASVCQVSAVAEVHSKDLVIGFEKCGINSTVRLRSGMGLHIGELAVEKFTGSVDRELLYHICIFTSAVVSFVGVALCIFVRKDRSHRFHNRRNGEVFRCDHLEMVRLSFSFIFNRLEYLRVKRFYGI